MASGKQKQKAPSWGGGFAGVVTLILGVSAAVAFWSDGQSLAKPEENRQPNRGAHHWHLNIDRGAETGDRSDTSAATPIHEPLPSFRIPTGPPTILAKPPLGDEGHPPSVLGNAPEISSGIPRNTLVPISPLASEPRLPPTPPPVPQGNSVVPPSAGMESAETVPESEQQKTVQTGAEQPALRGDTLPPAGHWQRPPASRPAARQRNSDETSVDSAAARSSDASQVKPTVESAVGGRVLDIRLAPSQTPDPAYRLTPRNR